MSRYLLVTAEALVLCIGIGLVLLHEKGLFSTQLYPPGTLKGYEVRFEWEAGIKSLRVINLETKAEETDSRLRKAALGAAREGLPGLMQQVRLNRAKGQYYISLMADREPFLSTYSGAKITEPDLAQLGAVAGDGNLTELKKLLAEGAEVNGRDIDGGGRTALMWAAAGGRIENVKELLAFGADPFVEDDHGSTALHYGALGESASVVKALIAARANLNARDQTGATPLAKAAWAGQAEVVRILLEAGADVNARDNRGQSALAIAESRGHLKVVEILRKAGGKR